MGSTFSFSKHHLCFVLSGFVTRDLLLPDLALLHGRSLVCAWETGLQDVQENVAKLIVHALEVCVTSSGPPTR